MKKAVVELLKIAHELSAHGKIAGDIYSDAVADAIKALRYVPVERAFQDKRKQGDVKKLRDGIVRQLEELLTEMPVETKYNVVGIGNRSEKFVDVSDLIAYMKRMGHEVTGYMTRPGMVPWLIGQPEFRGIIGPMSDGPKTVRYETQAVYDMLSV